MQSITSDDVLSNFVNDLVQTDVNFSKCLDVLNEELENYYDYINENPDDTVSLNIGAQCMSISLKNYAEAKYLESLSRVSLGEEANLLKEFNKVWESTFNSNNLIDDFFLEEIKCEWTELIV